ncbi:hypothetical protein C343_06481 [Cryptococcus neoformans C23]|uniref:Uncharacterized protein n=2 Tax=Cryptococcus neoformans TaxID=5207 RepID=A0A854Q293_CRYNE|nr:hypothetical protein CNAG_07923 [Cryptococcus neoformans var. grubii H99]AUB28657.1 hypothetical protein CKF44_07923 [Cryptococcus neoformans var. grubii]OWZ26832.1 hypothetical protein C347_06479 [Cryptococcus neoformans var. grubii AD2-60a]OWZ28487.1 hypothetical protein C353_06507 [Cryptococcus neoformans var. grubii AD1-83a]OWZ38693.1 hypothetical protein C343_06481 [Cryptococcus neoformans var. grubii C23]OWZ50165.1 hypothetical protein C368_06300 [Cryptococcus neoformans var. grubii 1|eukprot:XP_012053547.1 hypothetical protein CNAG_07923 [Cryptococcus neoformans var. grubii H99]
MEAAFDAAMSEQFPFPPRAARRNSHHPSPSKVASPSKSRIWNIFMEEAGRGSCQRGERG